MVDFKRKAGHGTFRKRKYDVVMVLLAILLPVMLLEVITVSLISGVAEAEMLSRDSVISGMISDLGGGAVTCLLSDLITYKGIYYYIMHRNRNTPIWSLGYIL